MKQINFWEDPQTFETHPDEVECAGCGTRGVPMMTFEHLNTTAVGRSIYKRIEEGKSKPNARYFAACKYCVGSSTLDDFLLRGKNHHITSNLSKMFHILEESLKADANLKMDRDPQGETFSIQGEVNHVTDSFQSMFKIFQSSVSESGEPVESLERQSMRKSSE